MVFRLKIAHESLVSMFGEVLSSSHLSLQLETDRKNEEREIRSKDRLSQWPFQEPKLEVPTIYKAYFLGLCKGIFPQNMAKHMVQYLHFRILEISH